MFGWVLGLLADRGLLKGKRVGVHATTLEASAAMRSIVRRDTGESYDEFLTGAGESFGHHDAVQKDSQVPSLGGDCTRIDLAGHSCRL